MIREIVKIDEELCDGCGECIPNCHEGALQIIDGKARLISELMCDGLGACLGHCPQNAITIEKREAEEYDEVTVIRQMIKSGKDTVFAHLKHLQDHNEMNYLNQALNYLKANNDNLPFSLNQVHELLNGKNENKKNLQHAPGGCPGSTTATFNASGLKINPHTNEAPSALTQWPIQLHLINPAASYFQGADLLIAADCAAFAHGNFHQKFLTGKKLVIACPKLDQGKDIYIQKITRLINEAKVHSITIIIMEVPCCGGLVGMVKTALENAEEDISVKVAVISIQGDIIIEQYI